MSSVVVNVAIGLLTSVVSGSLVWTWQRIRNLRRQSRYAAFFGFSAARECVIVIGRQTNNPQGIHRADVSALVEVASIANDAGARFQIRQPDQFREGAGRQVEFCLNGPDANARTGGHMATYLPGVRFKPYERGRPDSIAVVAGDLEFIREPGRKEHVVLARIFPSPGARPIFLIAGQTAVTNLAAAHFIHSRVEELRREHSTDRNFCLVLAVELPEIYGHESVHLERDITGVAFSA